MGETNRRSPFEKSNSVDNCPFYRDKTKKKLKFSWKSAKIYENFLFLVCIWTISTPEPLVNQCKTDFGEKNNGISFGCDFVKNCHFLGLKLKT